MCNNDMNRNKYIFENKGSTANVRLTAGILVKDNFGNKATGNTTAPSDMKINPLARAQAESPAGYFAERDETIFEFLLNEMKFHACEFSNEQKKQQLPADICPFYFDYDRCVTAYDFLQPKGPGIDSGKIYPASGARKAEVKRVYPADAAQHRNISAYRL